MDETNGSPRERIVRAASELLAEGGREGVTTRSVSRAAGVQAPTIYRQFGDMRGLLDEVASAGFAAYLQSKIARERAEDPLDDLRRGWDQHVAFGLANPAVFTLIYGDPRPGAVPPAAGEAAAILHGLVQRAAEAGRLRVGVELAARMIHAAGVGVVLALIGARPEARDQALSELMREAVLAAITTDAGDGEADEGLDGSRIAGRAVALKAVLPETATALSPAEYALLAEWLDRIVVSPGGRDR